MYGQRSMKERRKRMLMKIQQMKDKDGSSKDGGQESRQASEYSRKNQLNSSCNSREYSVGGGGWRKCSNPFYCSKCNVETSGRINFMQHTAGARHQRKTKNAEQLTMEEAKDQKCQAEKCSMHNNDVTHISEDKRCGIGDPYDKNNRSMDRSSLNKILETSFPFDHSFAGSFDCDTHTTAEDKLCSVGDPYNVEDRSIDRNLLKRTLDLSQSLPFEHSCSSSCDCNTRTTEDKLCGIVDPYNENDNSVDRSIKRPLETSLPFDHSYSNTRITEDKICGTVDPYIENDGSIDRSLLRRALKASLPFDHSCSSFCDCNIPTAGEDKQCGIDDDPYNEDDRSVDQSSLKIALEATLSFDHSFSGPFDGNICTTDDAEPCSSGDPYNEEDDSIDRSSSNRALGASSPFNHSCSSSIDCNIRTTEDDKLYSIGDPYSEDDRSTDLSSINGALETALSFDHSCSSSCDCSTRRMAGSEFSYKEHIFEYDACNRMREEEYMESENKEPEALIDNDFHGCDKSIKYDLENEREKIRSTSNGSVDALLPLYCDLCDVFASGPVPYEQHVKGGPHLKQLTKIEMLKLYDNQQKELELKYGTKPSDKTVFEGKHVKICTQHSNGEKSDSKASEIVDASPDFSIEFHCNVCGIATSGVTCYIQHVEGKYHQAAMSKMYEVDNFGLGFRLNANVDDSGKGIGYIQNNADHSKEEEASKKRVLDPFVDFSILFHCHICNFSGCGLIAYKKHLNGELHKKSLKREELMKSSAIKKEMEGKNRNETDKLNILQGPHWCQFDNRFSVITSCSDRNYQKPLPRLQTRLYSPFYCNVCDIAAYGFTSYQQHLRGKPHRKKLLATELHSRIDSPFYCTVCNTETSGRVSYQQHLKGKPHVKKLCKLQFSRAYGIYKNEIEEYNSCETFYSATNNHNKQNSSGVTYSKDEKSNNSLTKPGDFLVSFFPAAAHATFQSLNRFPMHNVVAQSYQKENMMSYVKSYEISK